MGAICVLSYCWHPAFMIARSIAPRLLCLVYVLQATVGLLTTTTTVFGATGGIGQLVCSRLLDSSSTPESAVVKAVTRNPGSIKGLGTNLQGCQVLKADARVLDVELMRAVRVKDTPQPLNPLSLHSTHLICAFVPPN